MAKGRKYKCPECGSMNDKEDATLIGKRYYCLGDCTDKTLEAQESKNRNKEDWEELFEYISEIYGHPPTGMMYKQLGEFRKDPYNYTNKGIYLTLKYFYETRGHQALKNSGIGIVPYVYEEAKQNYITQMKVSEHNINFESQESKEYVKINRGKNKCKQKIMNSLISFDDIDEELEDE